MSALTKFQTQVKELMLLQTDWISKLNPVIALPLLQGVQIKNVSLTASTPKTINTLLGRMQQGFILTNISSNANVWRTQPFNSLTLTLESNVDTVIDLWVF